MAAKKTIRKYGCVFKIFEKSVIIEGVVGAVYYAHAPTDRDLEQLGKIVKFGEQRASEKALKKAHKRLLNKFNSVFLD